MGKLYLIIDVEATCWPRGDPRTKESEIIEIGAVLLDLARPADVAEFQAFVKPVRHPTLSELCTELTSIAQADVDEAPGFADAMERLRRELLSGGRVLFCSWGDYDRKQLRQDCKFHKVKFPFGRHHLNIKQLFADTHRCRPCGMAQALSMLHLPLTGTHHRGLDDARNIATIARRLL